MKVNINLTPIQQEIWLFILKNEGCSMMEITKAVGCNYRSVWQNIKRFEYYGIVKVIKNEHLVGKKTQILPTTFPGYDKH